jgi:hypothetical protein
MTQKILADKKYTEKTLTPKKKKVTTVEDLDARLLDMDLTFARLLRVFSASVR